MKMIPLYRGDESEPAMFATVDDEDFERVNQFRWKVMESRPGKYYAVTRTRIPGGQALYYMHKFVISAINTADHINNNSLDNRRANLRELPSVTQNYWNRPKPKRNGGRPFQSKYKGVIPYKNRWLAHISAHGKRIRIGSFPTEEEAARAWDQAALKNHGIYACLNFPV